MKNKLTCKKCQIEFDFRSTGSPLCKNCVEQYPYFVSFIEEGAIGVIGRIFGRVEVSDYRNPMAYPFEEIRFFFSGEVGKSEKWESFNKFRQKWDFKNLNEKELEEVRKTLKEHFQDELKE